MKKRYENIIIGSGPAGLGCAFTLLENGVDGHDILILEKERYSTGGMRNDCKMNFSSIVPEGSERTRSIGFPEEYWTMDQVDDYLARTRKHLNPQLVPHRNMTTYQKRAERLGVELLDAEQAHLGTDGGLELIKRLYGELTEKGVEVLTGHEVVKVREGSLDIVCDEDGPVEVEFGNLVVAPGRKGFEFLQDVMKDLDIPYTDNVVDIGVRVETKKSNYTIVDDCYDPKFYFPNKVRTFCTNSGNAHVVKEKYDGFNIVNGHAYSKETGRDNGLVNFAMLKTVRLTEPMASGSKYAESLCRMTDALGGGKPIMQRVGDLRLGHRSHKETFNEDLYDFRPTLNATPGDVTVVMPDKIFEDIWSAMKKLDTICPGVMDPETIIYWPEIKFYSNKPEYLNGNFKVKDRIWFAGDGAGTSRGITAAWSSGIRVADDVLGISTN